MSDIQTILQLLQRQPTLGPPAYSTVTASPEYHRPAVKVQPVPLTASRFFSLAGTQVRMLSQNQWERHGQKKKSTALIA